MKKYDREKGRIYHLQRYHLIKAKMLNHLGGKCVVCNTEKNLEIHHKDPSEKKFALSNGWGRPWDDLVIELDKCELRCKDHHIDFHRAKHGTISRYRLYRCRCEPCRLAWNTACKRWQKNRKR